MELKPHQKRVLEERNELAGRVERLRQFIRSPAVRNVSGVELARLRKTDAMVCLGCVVRGDTAHFDFVAGENARGLTDVSRESGIPVANGVLTTNTMEQAIDRAGGSMGNKGAEAAACAVEMAQLMRQLRGVKG